MLIALDIMLAASIGSGIYHAWAYSRRVKVYLALVYLVAGASNLCAALAWLQPWGWRMPNVDWLLVITLVLLVAAGIASTQMGREAKKTYELYQSRLLFK